MIQGCDVIVTQPVADNYRDVEYLSTSYIIEHCKKDCVVILFDSCYFTFYYIDLMYTSFQGEPLHRPTDYHYKYMLECYRRGLSVEEYVQEYVNNLGLANLPADMALTALASRHERSVQKYPKAHVISAHDYIAENYRKRLLFYSMNHPAKEVLQHICEGIVDVLGARNTINYDADPLSNPKCILYKCVREAVDFDLPEPCVCGRRNVQDIAQLYYDTYREIDFV